MTRKTLMYFSIALGTGLIAACNSSDHPNGSIAPVPVAQTLDTQAVLALAQKTSETAYPFSVNGGLVTFTDTSDTAAPLQVNGM